MIVTRLAVIALLLIVSFSGAVGVVRAVGEIASPYLLLFSSFRALTSRAYLLDLTHSLEHALPLPPVSLATIAPTGDRVAYVVNDEATATSTLYIADWHTGTAMAALDIGEPITRVRWSPRGDAVAFFANTLEHRDAAIYWLTEDRVTRLTDGWTCDDLAWNPAGEALAVVGCRVGDRLDQQTAPLVIFEIDALDSPLQYTIRDLYGNRGVTWHPAGDRVLVVSERRGVGPHLTEINVQSGAQRYLAPTNFASGPAYAPNGDWIAHQAQMPEGALALYLAPVTPFDAPPRSDAGDFAGVQTANITTFSPLWSPDGAFLVLLTPNGRSYQTVVVSRDGQIIWRLNEPAPFNMEWVK